MKLECDYYIRVVYDNGKEMWVTNVEGKYAEWERKKEALKMSKDMAEDITLGLICNFIPAYVVEAPKDVFKFKND